MLAVDMESDPPAFDEENRMVDFENLVKMCGSLIRVDPIAENQNDPGQVPHPKALAVSHTSVIEFLTTQPVTIGSNRVYRFSRAKANLRIAETCLVYLRRFSNNDITWILDNIACYPFTLIGAWVWTYLYQEVESSSERINMSRLKGLILELFSSPTATLNWLMLYDLDIPVYKWKEIGFAAEMSHAKVGLYYAARLGLLDILKSLIEQGHLVDQDVGPPFGTPLVAASRYGRTHIVTLLLESGADPNLSVYKSPLAAACGNGHVAVTRILLSHGANPNKSSWQYGSQLVKTCLEGSYETAKVLVEEGAKIDMTDSVGRSALLKTALSPKSKLDLFEYLIIEGADPFQEDKRGCNSLHYAARAGKGDFIKKILDYGIDVNLTDRNGWSPLHWAVASKKDSAEVVDLLLERQCNKSLKDKQGRTAFDLAKTFEKQDEAAILDGTSQAYPESSGYSESRVEFERDLLCDGCEVVSISQLVPLAQLTESKGQKHCTPESWHRCNDCPDFDFCFRCILDKDIIHFKDHSFSNEPA